MKIRSAFMSELVYSVYSGTFFGEYTEDNRKNL